MTDVGIRSLTSSNSQAIHGLKISLGYKFYLMVFHGFFQYVLLRSIVSVRGVCKTQRPDQSWADMNKSADEADSDSDTRFFETLDTGSDTDSDTEKVRFSDKPSDTRVRPTLVRT